MRVFQVFAFIWLLNLSSSSDGQINEQFTIVLNNPLENFPLKNMEIDLEAKIVYVSGKNILYRLRVEKDMQRIKKQTGPDENCLPQLSPEELKEYCGDDYNTVMVVTPDSLITCGTLRGGLCMRRDKESLNITMTSPNVRLVSSDQASAVGIYLNINDTNSSQQLKNIILFAKQCTALPLSAKHLDQTAILSVLPDLSDINVGSSKYGRIFDIILSESVSVELDYRVVIENENFVFLLVNQNSQSKLVKICKYVDSEHPKRVYEDIPIYCNAGEINMTHVKHGIFISLSGKRYLIVLFSMSKPTRSAVCVFEENDIYEAFMKSRRHRLGCPKSDFPVEDVIFQADRGSPNVCMQYRDLNKTNEPLIGIYDAFYKGDYCNSVTNMVSYFGIIVGLLPLEGNAVYSTKFHRVTVVGSLTINNLTTLYIGTDNGSVIQVLYDKEKNRTSVLSEIKVDPSEIGAIRSLNGETYIMSQNKIVKLLPSKNCGQYSGNCQQCMDVNDFDCGWCVTKGVCSAYSECESRYWLPSMKNECLSLDLSVDLSRHVYKLEGKVLTMLTPLSYLENVPCNLDGFDIPQSLNADKIYCRISATINFAEERTSSTVPVGVFISIVAVIFILFLCISFLCYKWGVSQGQKLNKKNPQGNVADRYVYQSQNEDSSEENHTYEQPRQSTGETSMRRDEELTAYDVIL